jgi:hypothetical protein
MAEMIPKSEPRSWMPNSGGDALSDDPIRAKLLELYQHNLDRTRNEWMEAWNCIVQVSSAPRPIDKMRIHQDWLKGFSQRRVEDATYAFEMARQLGALEFRFAAGLVTKDDQQASLAA